MRKELNYLILILILLVSCEEKYQPAIEKTDGQLVVESLITNDLTKNFVHLSQTRNYNDNIPLLEVSGAVVELIEKQGYKIRATESNPGYYVFNSVPESGKNYFLRIGILSDIYESAEVTMPPLPTIANFHTEHVVKKVYVKNVEGTSHAIDKAGREFYVDLPVTNSSSYYRFDITTVWEWHCDLNPKTFSIIPTYYGWYVFFEKEKYNIAGPKNFSQAGKIEKHPLLTVSYDVYDYIYEDTLFSKYDTLYAKGCLLQLEQYGTSKESYEYREKLNSQFSAVGSLFDPIQNQVYGNIICKTNPSKVVYGYFDLNSYSQYRYFFNLSTPPDDFPIRQVFRYPDLPDRNGIMETQPVKGPPDEIPPPHSPPIWWEKLY